MRKPIGATRALMRIAKLRADLKFEISKFESRAKNCLTCKTPGACCLDAHFVNVHISRLEAVAIRKTLDDLPDSLRDKVGARIDDAILKYALKGGGDTFDKKFACPLFEPGVGCLVHDTAKPVPCIVHACYENKSDLPPDELPVKAEQQIDDLNTRAYGRPQPLLPLPLAISRTAAGRDA